MRYAFAFGAIVLSIAAVMGAISSRSAVAQQAVNRFVPAAPGGAGAGYVIRQLAPADQDGDEMAQLTAQDSQLGNEAESIAKQLADAADEKQKTELKEKLHDVLGRQFDAQQKAREVEVARVEAKVKKLRDTITKRSNARRAIIDKRLDQLLNEAEGLGWNSPAAGGGFGHVYMSQPNATLAPPGSGRSGVIVTTPVAR